MRSQPNPEPARWGDRDAVVDPSPIVRGDQAQGVLVLHGLTGTPHEVAPIAHALADAGYAVRAPLLAGHEDVDALEASTWRDWYASAEAEFVALRDGGTRKVAVVGFSMGSLLALRLAALRPRELEGIAALSVPLELPSWQRPIIAAAAKLRANAWVGALVGVLPKLRGPDVRIDRELRQSPSLPSFPFPTLSQFVDLQREIAGLLPLVRAPLLLMHGRYDHIAPPELSERVAQRVGSARVQRIVLPRSFHIIARDLDRDRSCDEVVRFIASVLPLPGSPPAHS